MPTRGVLYVHSSPSAVCPHVEWAVSRVLGVPVRMEWTAQPAEVPVGLRAQTQWSGRAGTAGMLATALRQWPMLRFEVTEEPSPGVDGERIAYTPSQGVFRSATSANGDIVVSEDRLRSVMTTASGPDALDHGLRRLLGMAWDEELEPYRQGGDGAPVTVLHQAI